MSTSNTRPRRKQRDKKTVPDQQYRRPSLSAPPPPQARVGENRSCLEAGQLTAYPNPYPSVVDPAQAGQCYPFPKQRTALGIPHFPSAAKPFWKSNRRPLFWTLIPSHPPLFPGQSRAAVPARPRPSGRNIQAPGRRQDWPIGLRCPVFRHGRQRPLPDPRRPSQTPPGFQKHARTAPGRDSARTAWSGEMCGTSRKGSGATSCGQRRDVTALRPLLCSTDFPSWPSEPSSPVSALVSAPWPPLCPSRCPRCSPCPSTLVRRQFHIAADYCYPARVWRCSIRRPAGSKDHANVAMTPSRSAVSPGSGPWRPNIACSGWSVPGPGYMGR